MASSGDQGAAKANLLRVLLPFTCDTLRIPDELAAEIGAEEALVVGPAGGKVKFWPVEVGQDGDGAFLGRGWPEFAEACETGAGWLLVLRHRGRGVLSVKAFDATCCLRELGAPASPAGTTSSKDSTHKPQFIRVLPKDFMEKMLIPAKFAQYIPKEFLDKGTAIVLSPIGKVFRIKLEMGQSDMFFTGGWSQFLKFHGITEANALLLRYEGNMVFTLKMFGPNGNQRLSKHKGNRGRQSERNVKMFMTDTEEQQEAPSACIQKQQEISTSSRKCKRENTWPSNVGQRRTKGSMASSKMKRSETNCAYELGPPAWLTKKIDTSMMRHHLTVPRPFCNAIGFQKHCMITLQDSMGSNISWQVHGHFYKNGSCQLGSGWKKFCQDIGFKNGDVLTVKVIKTQLWDVIITRS